MCVCVEMWSCVFTYGRVLVFMRYVRLCISAFVHMCLSRYKCVYVCVYVTERLSLSLPLFCVCVLNTL